MARNFAYFGFEPIVTAALAILVVVALSVLGHAALNPTAFF
jgi:hypothetical protein